MKPFLLYLSCLPLLLLTGCEKDDLGHDDYPTVEVSFTDDVPLATVRVFLENAKNARSCGIRWQAEWGGGSNSKGPELNSQTSPYLSTRVKKDKKNYAFEIFPGNELIRNRNWWSQGEIVYQAYVVTESGDTFYSEQKRYTFSSPLDFDINSAYEFQDNVPSVVGNFRIRSKNPLKDATDDFLKNVTEVGVYRSSTGGTDLKNDYTKIVGVMENETFKVPLPEFVIGETYYFVAYAQTNYGTMYSHIFSPLLEGGSITVSISQNYQNRTFEKVTVFGSCSVENPAAYQVLERGFCYFNTREITSGRMPNINDRKLAVTPGEGDFSGTITGLQAGTTYKVCAYAISRRGVYYSSTAVMLSLPLADAFVPLLYNFSADIAPGASRKVALQSQIFNDYGYTISERGFCYTSDGSSPTVNANKITAGAGLGTFSATTGELPAGTYIFKAYAINQAGIGYSVSYKEVVVP